MKAPASDLGQPVPGDDARLAPVSERPHRGMKVRRTQSGRAQLVEAAGTDSDIGPEYAAGLLQAGYFFWIDLAGIPPDRIDEFSTALELSADSMQHLVTEDQRSSFTVSHDGVRWTSGGIGEDGSLSQVRGVYTKSFLVTVHDRTSPGLAQARQRYERLRGGDQDDGPLVLFMVLDALANTFEGVLARLDGQLDHLEATILLGPPSPGYLAQVLQVRQALTPIMRALGPYRRDLVGILGDADRLGDAPRNPALPRFPSEPRHCPFRRGQ